MSARTRVVLVVAFAAAAAAAVTVGATVLTGGTPGEKAAPPAAGRKGAPPLVLDLGVRTDAEAIALRRAASVYNRGNRRAAGRILAGRSSLEAKVGLALASWPRGGVERLSALARAQPRRGVVQLNLGLALLWAGRRDSAAAAFRAAERRDPDSPYAVRAATLLHPTMAPGIPVFVPSFPPPAGLVRLSPAAQVAALARAARTPDVHAKLLYGVALQRLGRQLSAEREYAAAAALAPGDPEAQAAAAVGRFDKDDPSRAFSRLGPLARRFPRAPTVRFHLGLLLLWLGQVRQARVELRLAHAYAPVSPLGKEAEAYLQRLRGVRTG